MARAENHAERGGGAMRQTQLKRTAKRERTRTDPLPLFDPRDADVARAKRRLMNEKHAPSHEPDSASMNARPFPDAGTFPLRS